MLLFNVHNIVFKPLNRLIKKKMGKIRTRLLDRHELCTTGVLLAKPYRCTMFSFIKILFMFYNNCKYSCYNLPGKFENSSYKSLLVHALCAVYFNTAFMHK